MELIPALILAVVMLAREWSYQQERKENAKQTQALLQRIQAPTVAVQAHAVEGLPDREPIGMPLLADADYEQIAHYRAAFPDTP